ncbi:MAG: 50S ribosomal protein L5 [Patescibacteria group bacterium]
MAKIISAKTKYKEIVIPEMKKIFGYGNNLAVPRIEKCVVNVGTGKFAKETEKVEDIINSLAEICGQKPVKTKARKAISGFKIRQGLEIGAKATLRGKIMWNFIDHLINFALPRTRDFQGIDLKAIDDKGNMNLGIKEHIIFPEISPEKVKNIFSFQISIATNTENRKEAIELFRSLGFPMKS